jgi:predicted MFS family arabinose efflux permease
MTAGDQMQERSTRWWIEFGALLALTMGAATFFTTPVAVFAPDLIAEFGITRGQVGLLVTASALTGAMVSPSIGRVTDRLGGRLAAVSTLVAAAIGLGGLALAPSYLMLVLAGLVSGIGQAFSNPATNTLIGANVPPGRRGVITGIKQSGVQAAAAVGGFALPLIGSTLGWRAALGIAAAIPVLTITLALTAVGDDRAEGKGPGDSPLLIPKAIYRLSVYGFLMGFVNSAAITYLPLYAVEGFGWSGAGPGLLVGVSGIAGVIGRITWSRAAERRFGYRTVLMTLSVASVLVAACLSAAVGLGSFLIWPAAFLIGAGTASWNAVGMLAVIDRAPAGAAGRASGVVLLGFLLGLASGAPMMGFTVDQTGSYRLGWLVIGLVGIAAFFTARTLFVGDRLQDVPPRGTPGGQRGGSHSGKNGHPG